MPTPFFFTVSDISPSLFISECRNFVCFIVADDECALHWTLERGNFIFIFPFLPFPLVRTPFIGSPLRQRGVPTEDSRESKTARHRGNPKVVVKYLPVSFLSLSVFVFPFPVFVPLCFRGTKIPDCGGDCLTGSQRIIHALSLVILPRISIYIYPAAV